MPDRLVIIRPPATRLIVTHPGTQGPRGAGWSPALSVVADGERRVLQVVGWLGGIGTAPATGQYLGGAGLVDDITDATDVRGAVGEAGSVVRWEDVLDKPSTFPPASHTHTAAEVGADPVGSAAAAQAAAALDATAKANAAQAAATAAAATDATTKAIAARSGAESTAATALAAHVSAADPHTGYQLETEKGQANGYASLDGSGRVPASQLPPSGSIGGTLGATDNALTRADGTGGNTAQGSSVTLDDTATLLATNWTVTSGTFGGRTFSRFGSVGSNLALILSPTGTGFIASQVPDGTTTGGNLRGNNAIDFCYSRSAATQVASGVGSFNGGTSSTASGASSFAWCGQATNGLTFAMFGNASGNWSVSIGQATAASANGSLAAGEGAQATGDYSAAFCYANATGPHSVATGNRSLASLYGQFAHASGRFVSNGDCQSALLVARVATTDATPTTLFLDGASQRFLVPANSRGRMRITAVAATATAGGEMMTWTREVAWWRGVAASTTEVDVQTIGTDRGRTGGLWGSGPPWGFGISADTVNGGVNCSGTGAGATNIRWSMRVDIVMEVFP